MVESNAGPSLYVIGGADGHEHGNGKVDRARIEADGTLATFEELGDLPRPVGGHTGAAIGRVIAFTGGTVNGSAISARTYTSVVADDGALGAWQEQAEMPHKRMHPGSFVVGDSLYVAGGFENQTVWDDVVRAKVGADGSIREWQPAGTLPVPLTHFSVAERDGYVYFTGGLKETPYRAPVPQKIVWRGTLQADGSVADWQELPPLPERVCTHASFFYGGYLYVGAGLDGDYEPTAALHRAAVLDDHSLGAWEAVAGLSTGRGHLHQIPVYRNHVYAVAGAINVDLDSSAVIDIGTFTP